MTKIYLASVSIMAEPRISADVALQAPSQDEVGTNPRCLRVAVVTTYGSGHRFLYTISSNDNGAVVMTALREIVGASQHQVWLLRLLGKKPAIFQALVVLVSCMLSKRICWLTSLPPGKSCRCPGTRSLVLRRHRDLGVPTAAHSRIQ